MSKQTDKRRHILSESEINELYCLPRLNNIQREQSFSLPDEELKAVAAIAANAGRAQSATSRFGAARYLKGLCL